MKLQKSTMVDPIAMLNKDSDQTKLQTHLEDADEGVWAKELKETSLNRKRD